MAFVFWFKFRWHLLLRHQLTRAEQATSHYLNHCKTYSTDTYVRQNRTTRIELLHRTDNAPVPATSQNQYFATEMCDLWDGFVGGGVGRSATHQFLCYWSVHLLTAIRRNGERAICLQLEITVTDLAHGNMLHVIGKKVILSSEIRIKFVYHSHLFARCSRKTACYPGDISWAFWLFEAIQQLRLCTTGPLCWENHV